MECRKSRIFLLVFVVSVILAAIGIGLWLWLYWNGSETYLQQMVVRINNASNLKWKAKYNKFGVRAGEHVNGFYPQKVALSVPPLRGDFRSEKVQQHIREIMKLNESVLPKHFDARHKWPLCASINDVPNQGGCGSCYAVSAVAVAADRACIGTNGTVNTVLSSMDVLGCCENCGGGCNGGIPSSVFEYFIDQGIVSGGRDGCLPYEFDSECGIPCYQKHGPTYEKQRKCRKECQDVYYKNTFEQDKVHGSVMYSIVGTHEYMVKHLEDQYYLWGVHENSIVHYIQKQKWRRKLTRDEILTVMKKELFLSGPFIISVIVTEEFLHYHEGVFEYFPPNDIQDRLIYLHSVRVVGWGEIEGRTYWICCNSFGYHWGEDGFFRIFDDAIDSLSFHQMIQTVLV